MRHVADDFHRPSAKHVGGADDEGEPDLAGDREGLRVSKGDAVPGLAQAELVDQRLEALAILGEVDGVRRGAEDGDAFRLQRIRQLQGSLAAELHDDTVQCAVLLLDREHLHHVFECQRLEIQAVGRVVIGRDGLGVAVDHDGLEPCLAQGETGVAATIVELDPLADAVRPAAEDHYLSAV